MRPPPKIEAEGALVFDQVCVFEKLRRRRMPAIYCAVTLLIAICGLALMLVDRPVWAGVCLALAIFFSAISWLNWRELSRRYEKNLTILAEMERTYGDDLPWVAVEKHLTAVEQLKRDLAEEQKRKAE